MFGQVLRQYEDYIRSRQLVKEKQVKHYSNWVESFLVFASREKIREFDICLMRFLQEVENRAGVREWQVGQAKNAIRIYYFQFRKGGGGKACQPVDAINPADFVQVREKAIAVLRLKNYAYRTEEAYLKWIRQFYGFVKANRGAMATPVSEDVRNFITQFDRSTIQKAVKKAVAGAGIVKPASVHSLRPLPPTCSCRGRISAFALAWLRRDRSGKCRIIWDIRLRSGSYAVTSANLETTMIYTHIARELMPHADSPLDRLLA